MRSAQQLSVWPLHRGEPHNTPSRKPNNTLAPRWDKFVCGHSLLFNACPQEVKTFMMPPRLLHACTFLCLRRHCIVLAPHLVYVHECTDLATVVDIKA